MKNNKSPGSDGFSAEFFKFFWSDLKSFIVRAINSIYQNKKLPASQRLGIITCLPKGDKPRQYLKNWRPITLLNVFYKIISGCISLRIKSVLPYLISDTQTGFLSGRYIGENTRLLYDIMNYTEIHNIPGQVMLIDFEKAFDSVAWSFIFKVLNFFGFHSYIIEWIDILHLDIKATVLQNGFMSDHINIYRGCRQGDPVAPYIFLLCAEILSILIKNNKQIKGIVIDNKQFTISQYADDTTLFLDGSQKSLFEALNCLDQFAKISGLYINSAKTKIIWIGSKKFSKEVFHHDKWKLEWGITKFNSLGIDFSVNLQEITLINYKKQTSKVKNLLQHWSHRILTPKGRITVLKSLIIPILNHLFISLPNPQECVINSLRTEFFNFIWGSKVDRIKRDVLLQEKGKGGLEMVDLHKFIFSLKCSWIRRLILNNNPWNHILNATYNKDIAKCIVDFGDEYLEKLIKENKNKFWTDVFCALKQHTNYLHSSISSTNEFHKMLLFFNSNIRINRQSVYIKAWYDKNVKFVNDLFNANGKLMNKSDFEKKFNINNVCMLKYQGILGNIKMFMKQKKLNFENTNEVEPFIPNHLHCILKNRKGCKDIYKSFTNKTVIPTAMHRWNSTQIHDFKFDEWEQIFELTYKTTNDTLLQWLQYRTLHRILPTKHYLKKIKKIDSDICDFCGEETEDIPHLFFNCNCSQRLWSNLSDLIKAKTDINVQFTLFKVVFGEFNREMIPLNYIILVTKKYIYYTAKKKGHLHINGLQNCLNQMFQVSMFNAKKKLSLAEFQNKWQSWQGLFT